MLDNLPSKLLEDAVHELAKLPGVGKKTALRLVLHILKQEKEDANALGNSIIKLRNEIGYCKICHNISEHETCRICANPERDSSTICVIENIRDFIAIEHTTLYKGVYHILGGIISPMDGIGPNDLNMETLVSKVRDGNIKEVILALSTTMEGDTTNFYIFKRLKEFNVNITTIARGVAIGDELEYTDELTLGRSIMNRMPYESSLKKYN